VQFVIEHLLYSIELVPPDFWLFPVLKTHLIGIYFRYDEVKAEVKNGIENELDDISPTIFKNFFNIGLNV